MYKKLSIGGVVFCTGDVSIVPTFQIPEA